jgi:nucleotide-binding universal stress UspA family protein
MNAGRELLWRQVMGSRGLGAVSGLALGSVGRKVLHLAKVPVMFVKTAEK